jgi:hypothetical protein
VSTEGQVAVTTTTPSAAVREAWRDQRRWSNAANALKSGILFWRTTALGLAIASAVLATLATQVGLKTGFGQALSIAAAVVLAGLPVIRTTRLGKDRIAAWTRARSVSEGLKEEIYLHLTGSPPYDGADSGVTLARRCLAITEDARDIDGQTLGRPDDDKPLPDVNGVDSYLSNRVRPQIRWYSGGAAEQQRRLGQFRAVEFALAMLGVILGAVAAATKINAIGAWVAVVTTVAAAITAHIAAARYEHLVITYLSTARQLRARVTEWGVSTDRSSDAAARLIGECEDIISRENESWMAAWTRDEGEGAAPAPASP